jgi:poly(3-hydroxybutyrate) depolymerase
MYHRCLRVHPTSIRELIHRAAAFAICIGVAAAAAARTPAQTPAQTPDRIDGWPEAVRAVQYESPADGTMQPALFYAPKSGKPVPLLVALHTWGGDFKQPSGAAYAEWCIEHGWAIVHPDFRGPNSRPEATGSALVVADILAAVDYAKAHADIDADRIYLMGGSGGGHAALLMAGRAPKIWAAVSAWVPIFDLQQWHAEAASVAYRDLIEKSCGGAPGDSQDVDKEYTRRSPRTYFAEAKGVVVDINAGIRDGHDDATVPVSHSLDAFQAVAQPSDRLSDEDIEWMTRQAEVPSALRFTAQDASYGEHAVLFRRESGNARVTLFQGGHEILYSTGLRWLEKQKRGQPAVW